MIHRSRVLLGVVFPHQQGDVSQFVHEKYKTRFRGGQNLTAVEGNASVYPVYPVSHIIGKGRAEFLRA